MRDHKRAVGTLREKIESGERGGSTDDRDALMEFSRQMKLMRETYSWARHEKLLRHCTRIAEECGGLADSLTEKPATEEIVAWIHETYDLEESPETNQSYRVALKVFGRRTTPEEGGEPPDSIAWVKSTLPRDYDPTPDRGKMLEWEEAELMAGEGTHNARDGALIPVAYDLGARPGELYDVRRSDVLDTEFGMQILVDGKQGQRQPTLIKAVPYLQRWLGDGRCPSGSDYLWGNLDGSGQVSYARFLDIFKDAAGRVGVEKPVTPKNFRKSNAYWLAKRGARAALIEDRQGRKRGSKHVARYIARFGPENEQTQYARLHGIEVDVDEPDAQGPITCPRCERETPRSRPLCMWCQQALSPGAAKEVREQRAAHMQDAAESGGQIAEGVAELEALLEEYPVLRSLSVSHDDTSPSA